MGPSVVFVLMPALAFASIEVHIEVSAAETLASVTFKGTDNNIISDIENESFNLTASTLKAAAKAYAGATPVDVFVKSPTPWGDLYRTYKWSEVERNTEINKVKIVSFKDEQVTLATQYFTNDLTNSNSDFTTNMKVDVVYYVKHSVIGKKVSVDAKYNVLISRAFNSPIPMTLVAHLDADNKFEKEVKELQAETEEIEFNLKPSQSVICVLNATRVEIEVTVDYESILSGHVAANYNPKYQDHHFWAYDVNELLESVGVPTVQKHSDSVTIQFITNACLSVTDQDTGNVISLQRLFYLL